MTFRWIGTREPTPSDLSIDAIGLRLVVKLHSRIVLHFPSRKYTVNACRVAGAARRRQGSAARVFCGRCDISTRIASGALSFSHAARRILRNARSSRATRNAKDALSARMRPSRTRAPRAAAVSGGGDALALTRSTHT